MTKAFPFHLARWGAAVLIAGLFAAQAGAQTQDGLPSTRDIWRHLPGQTAAPDPVSPAPARPAPALTVQAPAGSPPAAPVARTEDRATARPRTLAQARVVIHYPERRGAIRPEALAERLRAAGAAEVETRAVARSVERLSVRYFHPADRAVSDRVGLLAGGEDGQAGVTDFTFYRPRPRAGTVEIWLP